MTDIEHTFQMQPAYDCAEGCMFDSERCAPGEGGYHGISSALAIFIARRDDLAVVFTMHAEWFLLDTAKRIKENREGAWLHIAEGLGSVSFHKPAPAVEERDEYLFFQQDCSYIGQDCISDSTYLGAADVYAVLVSKGHEAMWADLDERLEQWMKE